MLATEAEISVWAQAPGCLRKFGGIPSGKILKLYMQNRAKLCAFYSENCSNAVHNAIFKHFKMEMPFPCIPAVFQQWKRFSHAFTLEEHSLLFVLIVTGASCIFPTCL